MSGTLFFHKPTVAALPLVASFSQFLGDWPMNNADLALYSFGATHLRLCLWIELVPFPGASKGFLQRRGCLQNSTVTKPSIMQCRHSGTVATTARQSQPWQRVTANFRRLI